MFSAFFQRHERVALQISGGKDSKACLELLRPWLSKVTVVWGCQGNPYPETVEAMLKLAESVPHFAVVEGQQKSCVQQHGYPVDFLPLTSTPVGRLCGSNGMALQLASDCCARNLWQPMKDFITRGGYTGVIRGQKQSDKLKSPALSGVRCEGVEYLFPLEDWADEDVIKFLGDKIPESYKRGRLSSLDCKDCTAFLEENRGSADDLDHIDPVAAEKVRDVHRYLQQEMSAYVAKLGESA